MTCTNQYSHPAHQYSLWFPGRGISAARAKPLICAWQTLGAALLLGER